MLRAMNSEQTRPPPHNDWIDSAHTAPRRGLGDFPRRFASLLLQVLMEPSQPGRHAPNTRER
jgi:hypothetical protein